MFKLIARHAPLAVVVLLMSSSPSPAADVVKCTVATKGDSPVAQACARGGRAEAKKVMKEAVSAAKKNGGKFDCDDCHKGVADNNFELKSDAREKFKKLLTLAGGANQPAPGK
jgi:hypothetical protein